MSSAPPPDEFAEQLEAQRRWARRLESEALATVAADNAPQAQPAGAGDAAWLAFTAAARALGVPAESLQGAEAAAAVAERREDPYQVLARTALLRVRPVRLAADWWNQDGGPLLAYAAPDHRPVALLPAGSGVYDCYDPGVGRTRVTEATEARLERRAFHLYRAFPAGKFGALALMRFALADRSRDLALTALLSVVLTLLGMASLQALRLVIDHAIPSSDRPLLFQIGLGLLAVAVGGSLGDLTRGVLWLRLRYGAEHALQAGAWDRLLRLPPPFFRGYTSGDLLARVSAADEIHQTLTGEAFRTALASLFGLLNLALLAFFSGRLALLALAVGAVVGAATLVTSLAVVRVGRTLLEQEGKLQGLTVQLLHLVSKLRVAAAEDRAFAVWLRFYGGQKAQGLRLQTWRDSVAVFNDAMAVLATLAIFAVAGGLTGTAVGALSTGTFLAAFAAYGAFIGCTRDLGNSMTQVLQLVPLWRRAEPLLTAIPEMAAGRRDPGPLRGGVSLEHVSFRYRPDGPLVLDDVSLHIEPGQFVALVGPSGSGKTTLLRLVLGFERPQTGAVLYDGLDLARLDLAAVRRQLGVVLQNGRLTQGSLLENIAGGDLVTLREAEEAAEAAGLADDLARMPMGLHTLVSEGGSNLSGGQRQRVLLARALVLRPRLLLLDEATSSLDNHTQAFITEHLAQLRGTRIVIAHRLSTIRRADRIYVLEDGRLVQQGTFAELAQAAGPFARFIAGQSV